MLRVVFALLSMGLFVGCTVPGDPWLESSDAGTADDIGESGVPAEVEAVMQKYCAGGGCHDAVGPAFTANYALLFDPTPGFYASCDNSQSAAACSVVSMKDGSMPLGGACNEASPRDPSKCPTQSEIQLVEDWVNSLNYTENVKPILDQHCASCHGSFANPLFTADPSTLDGLSPGSYGCTGTVPECIESLMKSSVMPQSPDCSSSDNAASCPTQEEIDVISAWVAAGASH